MSSTYDDQHFFIPAATMTEAISRIFGLTGVQPQTRGEKRALIALRDALDLDVDVVRTNAVLGERLAEALGVEWRPAEHTILNKVTLDGLNALLAGATAAYRRGSLEQVAKPTPSTLVGPGWDSFNPAVSKIEAVTRIAGLTGAPDEWLGPGSKEHKSVLTNLADRLLPSVGLDRSSKTRLGRALALEFDVAWSDSCASTGETISLEGLNTILAGAERRIGRLGTTVAEMLATPEAEGKALTAALNDGWTAGPWDGRSSIEWMQKQGVRGLNDNEWQGFYFEARGREILNAAFPPSLMPVRARYRNTTFDYSMNYVWDLKAHTEEQFFPVTGHSRNGDPGVRLNEEQAIRECIADQGLGFLVLSGIALMDEDLTFVTWHRSFKAAQGKHSAASNSGKSTMRKVAFTPLHVEAFWIANTPALDSAVAAGQMKVIPQGRQAPKVQGDGGANRGDKFEMHITKARNGLRVAKRDWSTDFTAVDHLERPIRKGPRPPDGSRPTREVGSPAASTQLGLPPRASSRVAPTSGPADAPRRHSRTGHGRLLLIDGHSMAYRAFFALPKEDFSTITGQYTNAVYGFTSMLINVLRDEAPTHVGVAFDISRKTFRLDEYAGYKAGRSVTPDEFRGQISLLHEVLGALRIPYVQVDGFEAGDVLATLTTAAIDRDGIDEVLICSGDRDAFQLVNDKVTVLYPVKGVSELARITPSVVEIKYGVPPERYGDLAALVGESYDNLSGVPGVGPKTAATWIQRYGDLTGLVAHVTEITGKVGDSLRDHLDVVLRNRRLNQFIHQVPLDVTVDDLERKTWDRKEVHKVFDGLEFRVLRDRLVATLEAIEVEADSGFDVHGKLTS